MKQPILTTTASDDRKQARSMIGGDGRTLKPRLVYKGSRKRANRASRRACRVALARQSVSLASLGTPPCPAPFRPGPPVAR